MQKMQSSPLVQNSLVGSPVSKALEVESSTLQVEQEVSMLESALDQLADTLTPVLKPYAMQKASNIDGREPGGSPVGERLTSVATRIESLRGRINGLINCL